MIEKIRLQAYMASCGIASRRKCEEIILQGRVKVNGCKVTELGTKVGGNDTVTVDGVAITKEEHVYFALNKPQGYITTVSDEHDRPTVMDLILDEDKSNRIFPVGRLDYDTQGIIILTNDGELANKLIHPKSKIEKEYLARLEGIIDNKAVARLTYGVKLENYKTQPAKVEIIEVDKKNESTLISITITEGKNHEVKDMCKAVGYPVKKLTRVRFANISTEGLPRGAYRKLKIHEVKQLYNL